MTAGRTGHAAAVVRAVVTFVLWSLTATGALATAFFVAMLLTPGYGDVVIAVFAAAAALLTLCAGGTLRRRGRDRRARERRVVADVRRGQVLEQVAPDRRRSSISASAGGVLFGVSVVVAVSFGLEGPVGAWVVVGICALLFAMSLVQLAPGASWLRITTRGVMTRHLGHTRAHRWQDVDGFRVYEARTRYTSLDLVGWHVSEPVRADRRAARWLRWPSGVDDGLPTEYDADPEELAERLQHYRDRYVDVAASTVRQVEQ